MQHLFAHHTVTLSQYTQVLGNAKGAVAVVVSIMVFRNPVSFTGMVGYAVCVAGCFMYSEVCVDIYYKWIVACTWPAIHTMRP